jgi:putative pyruvate formate lyase activating enzyme
MYPSYLTLYEDGRLTERIDKAFSLLESCSLCPRRCGVNRLKDKRGFCKTGSLARVYSYMPHFGEEPPISGQRGSGTIFFSGCNMACVYCQNYKFSQLNEGRQVQPSELAQFMLELQESGCHNINLVTPTHVMPQILQALSLAIPRGLKLPLVYNTSGYELPEVIRLLQGIVDIFLTDMRYAEDEMSLRYSNTPDYPEYNQAAVKYMHRQAGIAQIDKQGLINKGLIIRHLVLPDNIAGTARIMRFIARQISPQAYISLMSQYLPCHKAGRYPELSRRISEQEYARAQEIMLSCGLSNGWLQESGGSSALAGINIKPK